MPSHRVNKRRDFRNRQAKAPSAGPAIRTAAAGEAPTQLMLVSEKLAEATREIGELKRGHAGGFEVDLESLMEGPFHLGPLNQERLDGLVENLRQNPLSSPIIVRATGKPGVFEIVAGRHRVAAFRILGRLKIIAVLRKLDDDETERVVFYDNLLAPNLSDYEKYLGFSRRQKSKQLTHEQLAAEAGVSRTWVTTLLALDRLPETARDLISRHPQKPGLSGKLFLDLSPLAETHSERVAQAVQRVIEGKLAAAGAAAWVKGAKPAAASPVFERVVLKRGRNKFAEVRTRGSQCVVDFAGAEDAREYGARILELLKAASSAGTPDR